MKAGFPKATAPALRPGPARRLRNIWICAALSGLFVSKTQKTMASEPKYLLAFGDSLTEGYYNYGTRFHPYSLKLQQLLDENGYNVKVSERGLSGERVVDDQPDSGMVVRLPKLLDYSAAEGRNFSWVVILGGINDIGWGADPYTVFTGLQSLYDTSRRHGARVLALTCLETATSRSDTKPNDERSRLNALIRGAGEEAEARGDAGFAVLDLEPLLPFPRDRYDAAGDALWDDGLHLTPAGYDRLAEIIYQGLRDKLDDG
ncbi:hypothetical protein Agub_g1197 [Astrephomene gubernaculifera]|uniref:SGNH hydrolase-type esterase domain-containing protein n=1 Tax=Astrephomene gubernaculifera TaxID=47775 RepID=A0AAD3DF08_9CHLO|nr:hypothetical protein Agub_g1197 [Astrephomene gubernaculifera]